MATIYLRHEVHGTKVAIAEEEALSDESNGWERYMLDDDREEDDVPAFLSPRRKGGRSKRTE
ncbi:hypothetical protein KGP36_04065 [Patescibacteria group bacterium]|nr:hypothetical protein [Patescibacteria group bacterium]